MIAKYIITLFITLLFVLPINSAGSDIISEKDKNKIKLSSFKKAISMFKKAKKFEKKGKTDKAKIKYTQAIGYLHDTNKSLPNQPGILNYLGYSYGKTGNYEYAEIYYRLGIKIDPNHVGINKYLGELYIQTGRIAKAKKRLKVLKNCNCDEYDELKEIIEID